MICCAVAIVTEGNDVKWHFHTYFREHFSNSINLGFLGKIHYQNCVVHLCVVGGFFVVHHEYFSVFLQVPTKQLLKIAKIRIYSISNHYHIFCYLLYLFGFDSIARGVPFYNMTSYKHKWILYGQWYGCKNSQVSFWFI